MAQWVKNPPAMQEMWVRFLEKGMATHSSILAWRIPCTKEPGGLQSKGLQSWTRLCDYRHTYTQAHAYACEYICMCSIYITVIYNY